MIELDEIDKKAASVLDGYLVRKDLVRTFSRQFPVPTYVVEFMLGRYCASTDQEEIDEGLEIVQRQLKSRTVRAGEEELFKAKALETGEVKIIDLVTARVDNKGEYVASLPSLRLTDVRISSELVNQHERMLTGGFYAELGVTLFSGEHLFADETPVLVGKRDPDRKRYSESWFWAFLGEAGCAFYHTPSRAFKEVEPLLSSYSGYLQSDGYNVYEKLAKQYPEITLVSCWAHARRKFVDAEKGGNAPEAKEALRYVRALYRIEARVRDKGLTPP